MTTFNLPLLLGLLAACAVFMVMEFRGLKTTLALNMKGDVKRETRWLAQYGQAVCTGVAALLVWQIDPSPARGRKALIVIGTVAAVSVAAMLVKRLASRVRPGHEGAGTFLGPTLRHNNRHESFPSSHSAAAVSLSVTLAVLYPQAAATFWGLALACAALRYVLDAHWPSDVLAGIALGYALAHLAAKLTHLTAV
jgi:membrane-associated phospholipid phosphatase